MRTLSSKLFWKLFASYAALVLVIVAVLGIGLWDSNPEVRTWLGVGGAIALAISTVFSLWLAGQVLTPLRDMVRTMSALESGDLSAQAPIAGPEETQELGRALNRLGGRLAEQIAQLTEQRTLLRAMLENMRVGVLALDDRDRILFHNTAASDLLGVPLSTGSRSPFWEQVRMRGLAEWLDQARRGERSEEWEFRVPGSHSDRHLIGHATAIAATGSPGLVLVFRDVSALRRLERVRQDFVANVSHELKTPLTSIRGFVETLLDDEAIEPGPHVHFLERILSNVDRLTHLVSDLLALARIESQGTDLALEELNVRDIILPIIERHEEQLRRNELSFEFEHPDREIQVLGDHESLTQVFENLLDNAIKYTPGPGWVRIRVGLRDDLVHLEVEDSGIGIPESEQGRIFERFYRVDKARSRELGGTGLGLAIVKHRIQGMRGSIGVDSEVGQGSRFTVKLRRSA